MTVYFNGTKWVGLTHGFTVVALASSKAELLQKLAQLVG